MIALEDEQVRPPGGAGFGEAVSFAWGDAELGVFGSARLGLSPGEPARATGVGLLFHDGRPVATAVDHAEVAAPDWTTLSAGAVSTATLAPLERWRVGLETQDGGFDLEVSALSPPAELSAQSSPAARAAALTGYEQLCAVRGTARTGARTFDVDCLGQRGRQWGAPDWDRLALSRTVSAWLAPDLAVGVAAVRTAADADGHGEEQLSAWLVHRAGDEATALSEVAEPRLSTTYDEAGHHRRAGLELWVGEDDDFPRRAAGEALCGASLELGRLRLDVAFLLWRMEGRVGVGRYDVLRPV